MTADDRPEWGDVSMDALIARANARANTPRLGKNTARETDADILVIRDLIAALAAARQEVISRSLLRELTQAMGWAPNLNDFKPSVRASMWAHIVGDAPRVSELAGIGHRLREQWPSHWSNDDVLSDLHARFHEQHGNLMGKDECGWESCTFWEGAKFVVENMVAVALPKPAKPAGRPALCPECVQGKHVNCDGMALNSETDEIVECACEVPR